MMFGVPLFGEVAKLIREIVRLVRQKRLPVEELRQFVADANPLASNCQSDLEQLLVLNSSNGTSHVFNLSANQLQNRNYVLQNTLGTDRTDGKLSEFLRGQIINLSAIKLQSICRIKYALA